MPRFALAPRLTPAWQWSSPSPETPEPEQPSITAPVAPRSRVSVLTLTLESAWQEIQKRHPEVPNVVVVIGPVSMDRGKADRYGHFTLNPTWNVRDCVQHEVLISAEGLGKGARQVFRTLLHERVFTRGR